ncbi:MAG: hypothetical protein M1500_03110 [Candidatus Marsarchaeota archaeon]|nr:hypothetical protein [Candidatus Marsarchaeota archaeon]MCL5112671.1 hypothetical protein [Candidatus Marsarchaeota archaeon]
MSKVVVVFKVYPKDDAFDKAVEEIKGMGPNDIKSEDIGFGIKVIKVSFIYEDSAGGSSDIEDRLKKLESISEVEVAEETLL